MEPILVMIAAFAGMLGILIGGVVGFLIGRRGKTSPASEVAPVQPPPPPPPQPVRNTPKDSVEVLSLWRNERTTKMVVMLETKPVSPSHLTQDQKTKISQILSSLHTMIGDPAPVAAPAPEVTPPQLETPAEPVSSIAFLPDDTHTEATSSALGDPSPDAGTSPAPDQPQKVYFADTLPEPVTIGQALLSNPFKITPPSSVQKSTSAPKTIIQQIDEIFQAKLVGTAFEDEKIELKESANGMTILIGAYKYEGVDAVPDPAIRALIKESAREWNEKVSRKR
ncbi:MAG: hypothetical protein HUU38_13220 [Anaerolineales bacterium]|jgi:hypothetical protein|nr:hypothetical protein [Anaerolineales bacterium]